MKYIVTVNFEFEYGIETENEKEAYKQAKELLHYRDVFNLMTKTDGYVVDVREEVE